MLKEIDILVCFGLFIVYFLLDMIYGCYIIAVQNLREVLSSILSIAIYVISAIGIFKIADNPWYTIPIALGAGLGTYVIIRIEKRKKQKSDVKKNS